MDLTPGIVKSRPKVTLGVLALVLSQLMRLAHPHERGWEFASGFMLGFAAALMISALVEHYRKRD
jgi:hypothetical protein